MQAQLTKTHPHDRVQGQKSVKEKTDPMLLTRYRIKRCKEENGGIMGKCKDAPKSYKIHHSHTLYNMLDSFKVRVRLISVIIRVKMLGVGCPKWTEGNYVFAGGKYLRKENWWNLIALAFLKFISILILPIRYLLRAHNIYVHVGRTGWEPGRSRP